VVRSAKDRAWDTMRDKVRYISLLWAAQAFRRAMSYLRDLSSIPMPCHTFSVECDVHGYFLWMGTIVRMMMSQSLVIDHMRVSVSDVNYCKHLK
jgi:hypothetical protein